MFENPYDTTHQFEGLLAQLWTIWEKDVARAVLLARWYWQELPEELVQQGRELAQVQAMASQASTSGRQIEDQVNAQLGAIGIFSAPGRGGPQVSGWVDPNPARSSFITIMGMIREHQGDPPAAAEMAQNAEPVLRGQAGPLDALVLAVPSHLQQQIVPALQAIQMLGDETMSGFLRLIGIVTAALALPRDRIPALLPGLATPEQRPGA